MSSIHTKKEEYWSQFAEDFEERNNYVVGTRNLNMLYDKLSKEHKLGNTLELACGNGTYTKIIQTNATHVVATDYSDEMVHSATSRLSAFDKISVQKENCFQLSFESKSFDTIFMANLIHVIPTPDIALKECYRVLKDGGQLIIVSYTTEDLNFLNKLSMIYRYKRTYGNPSPTAYPLTRALAAKMVRSEGFHVNTCELVGKSMKAVYLKARK